MKLPRCQFLHLAAGAGREVISRGLKALLQERTGGALGGRVDVKSHES